MMDAAPFCAEVLYALFPVWPYAAMSPDAIVPVKSGSLVQFPLMLFWFATIFPAADVIALSTTTGEAPAIAIDNSIPATSAAIDVLRILDPPRMHYEMFL